MNNWHLTENELPNPGTFVIFISNKDEPRWKNFIRYGIFKENRFYIDSYWFDIYQVKYWLSPSEVELPTEDKMEKEYCSHSGVELKKAREFKVGDKVSLKDRGKEGKIIYISNDNHKHCYLVIYKEDNDELSEWYAESELLLIPKTKKYYIIVYKDYGKFKTDITDSELYFDSVSYHQEIKRLEFEVEE